MQAEVNHMTNRDYFRLVLPRQHGAWSVLVASFVLGVAALGRLVPEGLLLAMILCGFISHHAAGKYLMLPDADERRPIVMTWAIGFATCAVGFAFLLAVVVKAVFAVLLRQKNPISIRRAEGSMLY